MTILDKIKSLGESASTWLLAGMPVVSREQYEDRLNLCKICNYYNINGTCDHCGCVMKVKAWLATEPCSDPAHPKWPAIDKTDE
jgi:hypothetical protein